MPKKPKLKPCPFCGEKPSSQKLGKDDWMVQCVNGHTATMVIHIWNKRHAKEN